MGKFFMLLYTRKVDNVWVEILDWLFSEKRFDNSSIWNKGTKARFTKRVKKHLGITDKIGSSLKEIEETKTSGIKIIVKHTVSNSEGECLIRHIRNALAHGSADIKQVRGEPWVYIENYNLTGRKNAIIQVPLKDVEILYKIYRDIERTAQNDKSRKR